MKPILVLLCMCFGVQGIKGVSNITLGSLPAKERNRRLIPYMTYYLGPQNTQYRQVMAVPYVPVQQYRQVPQRYIQQQATPLTRMITQNYLAIAKQLQGNPRLQTRVVNPNISPDLKYLIPVTHPQQNIVQIPASQYAKPQNVLQYVKSQNEEQYTKPIENDYDLREQEPQNNEQYAKPPADALLQYVKPEVQQYVAKFRGQIPYTKQEQVDYDDNEPQTGPIQFVQKAVDTQHYQKHEEPQQYITKQENDAPIHAYSRKPVFQFIPKGAIVPSKLAPQPAPIPEYITRPIPKPVAQHPRTEKTSVTIMQSQEIDVDALPSTPSPGPRYHATYVAKPEASYIAKPESTYISKSETSFIAKPESTYRLKQETSYIAKPEIYSQYEQQTYQEEQTAEDLDPEVVDKNLNEILQGLSISKSLPEKITSENLGSSIKTLSKILRILQRAHALPQSAKDIVRGFPKPNEVRTKSPNIKIRPQPVYTDGSTPGRSGIDYPNYDEIPKTQFSCKEQRYKGFFGDPETGCQVWHYCDLNGGQASFLCPNGTIFSQVALTCDWWFNVKCATTAQLYVLNERLYKYILPQKPSFPEDYSGPLVDHYLSLKFKEIEEKNKNKTEEHKDESTDEEEQPFSIDVETQNKVRSTQ